MMGTSARFVFLYRPAAAIVEIIPHENIARIVVGAADAATGPPKPTGASTP